MVRLTSGIRHHLADVALVPERVVLVLAGEVPERGVDDPARRVAKAAQAAAELDLVDAWLLPVAAYGQQASAGRLLGPELGVLGGAHVDDRRHCGERLNVVEQRRPAPGPLDGGEGGTRARLRALALERLEQR